MALPALRPGSAFRDAVFGGSYTRQSLVDDLLAGLTAGVVVIPFAMALAVASGFPPQHGLYSAVIGGALIALLGGSRFSISGPSVAFVIIIYPVGQQYGLAGVMVATLMAGLLQVFMGLTQTGRLLAFLPRPVTMGFTAGIAAAIVSMQLGEFMGLGLSSGATAIGSRVAELMLALPQIDTPSIAVALLTMAVLVFWPKFSSALPAPLVGLVVGSLVAWGLNHYGYSVDTVGSRFSYLLDDGVRAYGVPPVLPDLQWPWALDGARGAELIWSFDILQALVPVALAIALLGGIESLMCAVVLEDMTDTRHRPSEELLGQGLANIVLSFLAGLPAAASVTTSITSLRARMRSPIASLVHAAVVALGLLVLAPVLAYLPLAAMAALMLRVAWSMLVSSHMIGLLRRSPASDTLVFLSCFALTIFYGMILAIAVGILMSALLFVREIARMTKVSDISAHKRLVPKPLPPGWAIYKINGPLFFAAADRVFGELERLAHKRRGMILYMDNVSLIDAGGLAALSRFREHLQRFGCRLVIADVQFQVLRAFTRAGVQPAGNAFLVTSTLAVAIERLLSGELDPEAIVPAPAENEGGSPKLG